MRRIRVQMMAVEDEYQYLLEATQAEHAHTQLVTVNSNSQTDSRQFLLCPAGLLDRPSLSSAKTLSHNRVCVSQTQWCERVAL